MAAARKIRKMTNRRSAKSAELKAENARLKEIITKAQTLQPKEDWHEDDGVALWWKVPICEPPYVGTPLDDDFPEYVTHWTTVLIPEMDDVRLNTLENAVKEIPLPLTWPSGHSVCVFVKSIGENEVKISDWGNIASELFANGHNSVPPIVRQVGKTLGLTLGKADVWEAQVPARSQNDTIAAFQAIATIAIKILREPATPTHVWVKNSADSEPDLFAAAHFEVEDDLNE